MTTNLYNYTVNKSSTEQIEQHLLGVSGQFIPALKTYVDINEYSKKIREFAYTFEAWENEKLIGLVACYLNNKDTLEGYITNVSVLTDYEGRGVGSAMLRKVINTAKELGFNKLKLEVEVENNGAINLYKKHGFILSSRVGEKYEMLSRLNENKNITVSVCCVTYNHKNYIREAIEGFLMQKTNFPIEILIHDDGSTDGTTDIIKEYEQKYSDIIKPIYQKENQYSQGRPISAVYQFPRALGKYIALCEGDDYWTDPYKLQKQVDFLEKNSDYGLVHGDVNHLYMNTGKMVHAYNKTNKIIIPEGQIFEDLMRPSHLIKTMTVCFRKDLLEKYYLNNNEVLQSNWRFIDISVWLMFSYHSKIHYFDEVFATYRLSDESASRSKNPIVLYKAHQNVFAIREYFANRYDVDNNIKKDIMVHIYRSNLMDAYGIKSKEISECAYKELKKIKARLTLKEKIFYYGTKYNLLRILIEIFK